MEILELTCKVPELLAMKVYPSVLYSIGNQELLKKRKISIVGSRNPINYTKNATFEIANKLSQVGVCIISGGAMGVDALAHKGAGVSNTIMVAGTGLDKRYPHVNHILIEEIEKQGLVLSQFQVGSPSNKWNFPLRNEVIVALGEALIVTQADVNSGSMRSMEFAQKMGKPIFVLPHRTGDSEGSNAFLAKGLATPIYDIDAFVAQFGHIEPHVGDNFLAYCTTNPLYNDAIALYGEKVFEYEYLGQIIVEHGRIKRI
ncbi:MAG: DNA-processing protein DprA [Sulfurospirillaceae bacterium]|nr:DNA-processing protein DprA [Sulfurospirillaceae bacterium]MDD2826056.1 DNA-processing protein DprA [Sulfurospirillaceae bacterium]